MKIEVTKEDIEHGVRVSCRKCPVARALNRALGVEDVITDDQHFNYTKDNRLKFGHLPVFVSLKIQMFDATGEMEPFGFEIDL